MDVKIWIINWFEENTNLKKDEIGNSISKNYFEMGWIDSFKFISFINDIEKKFNINFSNEEFQNRAFSNIEGLIKIIQGKINEKK